MNQKQLNNIPLKDTIGYGVGNLGFGIVFQIIASYLVFYGTAILNIPGSFIGLTVSIGVVWDAITDPIMGYISDKTKSIRFGRRHLYIIIGFLGISISNYFLWIVNPQLSGNYKFLWIFADLILIKSFLTIYATPYTALGAELSNNYNERTTIQGSKTIFFIMGIGLATVLGVLIFFKPTAEYALGQLNPAAYRNLGLSASIIMLFSGIICYLATRKYIPVLPKLVKSPDESKWLSRLVKDFKAALSNKDYSYIVYAYLFTNIASALVSTFGLHVFTYTFGMNNNNIALIFGVQVAVCILAQPIWIRISSRLDKKPSALLGLTINIIGGLYFMLLVFCRNSIVGNIALMLPYSFITGFGTSGLFTLPLSMVADTIDVEEYKHGIRTEGIYYGCMTFFYKLSQSVVIFFLGILLDLMRFNPDLPVQPESTALLLGLTISVGSIIAFLLAIICYYKYSLNKNYIEGIQYELNKK